MPGRREDGKKYTGSFLPHLLALPFFRLCILKSSFLKDNAGKAEIREKILGKLFSLPFSPYRLSGYAF